MERDSIASCQGCHSHWVYNRESIPVILPTILKPHLPKLLQKFANNNNYYSYATLQLTRGGIEESNHI